MPADKVTVKSGWVTLSGTVDWQFQKEAAARCVRYLMGVTSVSNLIEIKPAAKWIEVKDKIEAAFRRNADIDARRINVNTSAGAVTLSGSVSSWAERDEAASATWSAPGVSMVNDDIIVAP